MKKPRINQALNELINERQADRETAARPVMGKLLTGSSGTLAIDISGIRVMRGLNVLVDTLIKSVLDQCAFGHSDVLVEQHVSQEQQPELHALGVTMVTFTARFSVIDALLTFHEVVGHQFRYMLNAIQRTDLLEALFPAAGQTSHGLLFPFHREDVTDETGYYYLVEYVAAGRFLRITLESESDARLRLTRIPHTVVDRIDLVHTRIDIPNNAKLIAHGIIEACEHQKWSWAITDTHCADLLQFLRTAGLPELELICITWPASFAGSAPMSSQASLQPHMQRVLSVSADAHLITPMRNHRCITLHDGLMTTYLDLSQRERCLNIALMEPRHQSALPEYLARMPAVSTTVLKQPNVFTNTRVLLIHHLTAEVLGLIQALTEMGARQVDTLWVRYAGVIEMAYREVMLSLPEHSHRFFGLSAAADADGLDLRFVLSDAFTPAPHLLPLANHLQHTPLHFLEAMRITASHLLFDLVRACRRDGSRLLIIEDGGYLAPVVNRWSLENVSVNRAAQQYGVPDTWIDPDTRDRPVAGWLGDTLIGSVEHTRNGYDALCDVQQQHGRLAWPAATIAISNYKVHIESRDVVYSCLNAVENVLNQMGFSLSERTALVLGAQGALGRQAMHILRQRLGADRLYGIDLVEPEMAVEWTSACRPGDLPDRALEQIDLVFGVVGKSILQTDWLERWLMVTRKRDLFLASGSTKTAEFSDVSNWLSDILHSRRRLPDGSELHVHVTDIHDPKTGVHQGRSARLEYGVHTVRMHLLADLMPVNFLYYGVPAETMDTVMNQLLQVSALMVARQAAGNPLNPRLWALDHELRV